MNAENFVAYLKNPSKLYQLSYEELRSLVVQYPYASTLRHLLLQKSFQEHRDVERNLEAAAIFGIDRKHLRQLYINYQTELAKEEQLELKADVLDLQPLNQLKDIQNQELPKEQVASPETPNLRYLEEEDLPEEANPTVNTAPQKEEPIFHFDDLFEDSEPSVKTKAQDSDVNLMSLEELLANEQTKAVKDTEEEATLEAANASIEEEPQVEEPAAEIPLEIVEPEEPEVPASSPVMELESPSFVLEEDF